MVDPVTPAGGANQSIMLCCVIKSLDGNWPLTMWSPRMSEGDPFVVLKGLAHCGQAVAPEVQRRMDYCPFACL